MIEYVRRQLHAVAILGALGPHPSGDVQIGTLGRLFQQISWRILGATRLTRNNELARKVHVCDGVVEERAAPLQVRRVVAHDDQVGRDPK